MIDDVEQARRIADHLIWRARAKYRIDDLISPADVARARSELYKLMKYTMGSSFAICQSYALDGMEYFEKSFADETAALLLGLLSSAGETPELRIPKWAADAAIALVGAEERPLAALLSSWGIPVPIAEAAAAAIVEWATRRIDLAQRTWVKPRDYDIDNALIDKALATAGELLAGKRWISMGGVIQGDPIAVTNHDGRTQLFVRGGEGTLWTRFQMKVAGRWSPWIKLIEGGVEGTPAAWRKPNGCLFVCYTSTDKALRFISQVWPGSPVWTKASDGFLEGGLTSGPSVAEDLQGRLHVFAKGTGADIWTRREASPGGSWTPWHNLGGKFSGSPKAARQADGRLIVATRGLGGDGSLYYIVQDASDPSKWSTWEQGALEGNLLGDPAIAALPDGRLIVFARGADDYLYHLVQSKPNASTWAPWAFLDPCGKLAGSPLVAINADRRVNVFARKLDGGLVHRAQLTTSRADWAGCQHLGGRLEGQACAVTSADHRVQVFARGLDKALWVRWQDQPNGQAFNE